jgi:hypothetical protein
MVNIRKKYPIEFKLKVDSEACTMKITLKSYVGFGSHVNIFIGREFNVEGVVYL